LSKSRSHILLQQQQQQQQKLKQKQTCPQQNPHTALPPSEPGRSASRLSSKCKSHGRQEQQQQLQHKNKQQQKNKPVNSGIFILLSHHQKRVGLRVGCRVSTKVMDVYPINHLGLWPLVVVVVLDSVGHVLAYVAVFHLNVAPGKINGLEGVKFWQIGCSHNL
jgi:hypothetical protein